MSIVLHCKYDGKMLVGGSFSVNSWNNIARFYPDGTWDSTITNLSLNGGVYSIVVQPDGKILLGGAFTNISFPLNYTIRLMPDGSVDGSFEPNPNGNVYALAMDSLGRILAGGMFTGICGSSANTQWTRIARLNTDGTCDANFVPSPNNTVWSIAVGDSGNILIGGDFTSVGLTTRNHVARLTPSGGLDSTFDPDADGAVNSIVVQTDGKILIGGAFTHVKGSLRNRIARLNADGTLDTGFDPNANNTINAIALQADGKIIIGGLFTTIAGSTTRNHIARLNADGTLDTGFDPNANNTVYAIALQADGKIIIGGMFDTIGGSTTRNRIARLNTNGTLDTAFDPNANGQVNSIAQQEDGKVLIGGSFFYVGGIERWHLARVTNTDAALQEISSDGMTITWKRSGAAPEVQRVVYRINSGTGWGPDHSATRIAGGWQYNLPAYLNAGQINYIDARGYPGGTGGLISESIKQVYVTPLTLTITKAGTGSGTVLASTGLINWSGNTGTTTCGYNYSVDLTGSASVGSTFAGWSGEGCTGIGTCTVTMDAAKSVTATFNVSTYTVTPSAGANGSISPNTPQTVNYNGTTSFTMTPDTGYHIDSVTGCGGLLSGGTYTTGAITADCTVTASFAINTYTVTPSAGTHGIILPTTPQSVNYGATATFTVMPEFGYHIDTVTGCGGSLSGQTYTTGAITTNCTVTASFAADPVNGVCGTADGQTFTTAPSANLCVDGTATAVTGTGPWTWSCTGLNGGTTASCSANIQTYTVTPTAGANGSISPNTAQTVNYNGTTAFTITAANGYAIQSVMGCGGSMTNANTYTTGAITANCTVTASFTNSPVNGACGTANGQTFTIAPSVNLCASGTPGAVSGAGPWTWSCSGANGGTTASCSASIQTYTVTPSAGTGGTISPNTAQTVNYNGTKAFTVTPNTGYHISSVTGCGGSLSGNTYTTGATTANCSITASFAINTYTVTPSAGAGGSISPNTAQTVNYNGTKAFTVTPNTGYHISSVTGCGGSLSGNTYTTGAITANCTVTASFAINTYTVTPSAGTGGSISPNTAQTVNYNGTKAFTVTPNTGYHISSVTGCGGSLSGNTYTTGAITANCTVTATFGADTSASPTGDLTGDGTVDATDALKALRIAAGIDTVTSGDLSKGDVAPLVSGTPHPDGQIDIGDVVVILRKAVGLISW